MEKLQLILTDFQGPLDLLLHLIRQSKIDIYDIPIAQITEQYIAYLHQMQSLQLDIAGDYLVMASTLMRIKSQLLLPKSPISTEEEASEPEDPRSDLVAQLLTYQTFKNMASTLKNLEKQRQQMYAKAPATLTPDTVVHLKPGVKVAQDLARAMQDLITRQAKQQRQQANIITEQISIAQAQDEILKYLKTKHQTTFRYLLSHQQTVEEVVTKFMALLELIKDQIIEAQQSSWQADILVKLR
ncbi:segregation and condensation protein A [Bombilactobacillus bombi]|uniref:segregation and condensation protein A n=1 Tax=Bombilactobacillus bombi TaxID=1303590 RepID=UPI001C63088D|nr:segregation/condensation protein A [Bombilactobacillus bombi]